MQAISDGRRPAILFMYRIEMTAKATVMPLSRGESMNVDDTEGLSEIRISEFRCSLQTTKASSMGCEFTPSTYVESCIMALSSCYD
jgi:hypothetical protein